MSLSTELREELSAGLKPVQESDQAGTFNQVVNLKLRFAVSFGYRVFLTDLWGIVGASGKNYNKCCVSAISN